MSNERTSPSKKAKELAKYLRNDRPDYLYLKSVFRHLRQELDINISKQSKKLPYVPSEEEITKYYQAVWQSRNMQNMVIIKTMLYTGVRVGELVKIKLNDVDFTNCHIRINNGKGSKDRVVPFPKMFKEVLAMHYDNAIKKGNVYLFESSWKKAYTDRGIRKILMHYTKLSGMDSSISPHKLRHFLFTWMKKQGIDDALIQPYSGHESRQSLEVYSRLSITDAQKEYDKIIDQFPV